MTYLFNDDKTKISLTDAIKTIFGTKQVTIAANNPGSATFDLQSYELYSQGYRPKGIVGWSINDSEVRITGVDMSSSVQCKVSLYNPKSYATTVLVYVTILWVKG